MQTTLRPTLRPPVNLVARRAIGYWTLRALPAWLVLTAAQIIWWVSDPSNAGWHVSVLVVVSIIGIAYLIVMPQWRYRVHRWETTDQAVYTQTGWFTQERRIAPINRIQTVDMHRGPFERLFRLGNVTVTTASAAGPIHIHGLDLDVAQHLVDNLTTITQASEGDAT
ncbi:MAG TPA: PH domain-containing protein [Micromonosporaceae bacterium]|nr:PH domain-containing protein [Micromonosporaceae bacterium]